MQIALDGKTELAAYAGELGEAHVAEFRLAYAEIAESEGEAVIGIKLLGSAYAPLSVLRCGPAEPSVSRRSQTCC